MKLKKTLLLGLLIAVLFSFSCNKWQDNEIWIYNTTPNEINYDFGNATKFNFLKYSIPPSEKVLINSDHYDSVFKILKTDCEITSISFYNTEDTVTWHPPLVNAPSSEHSFFNENSWKIEHKKVKKLFGKKEFVIATFTITEDDFKKD